LSAMSLRVDFASIQGVYTLTSDLLIQPIKSNVELKIQPRKQYYTIT